MQRCGCKVTLKVVLEVLLDVPELLLEVLDLSWRSWTFTEASEVWVRVDWQPLNLCRKKLKKSAEKI